MKQKRFHWLGMMINENQYSIGVEVGAAVGYTTEFLLKNCPTLKKITVVDLWEPVPGSSLFDREDMEELFRSKFEGESRIAVLKGVSWEMADKIADESLDFAFIDADHSYYSITRDLKAWYPKVKQGGLFCGHDIHFPAVKKAVVEKFGNLKLRHAGIDNVWYVTV